MNAEQASKLRAEFPAEAIGKLPKLTCKACSDKNCSEHRKTRCSVCGNYISTAHIDLDYVGHAATTERLLSVDPNWTWEPFALTAEGLPSFDGVNGLWIKLTVCGVTRLGYGDGKTVKEVIGDAIRNAAMRFGVALDLWAKQDLSNVGESTGTSDPPSAQAAPTAAASPASSGAGGQSPPVSDSIPPSADLGADAGGGEEAEGNSSVTTRTGEGVTITQGEPSASDQYLNDQQAKAIRDLFGGQQKFVRVAQEHFGEHIRRAADLTVAQAQELAALKQAAA